MGRPIKISKGQNIDTGYGNQLGLGIIGGDTTIPGSQVKVRFKINGTEADGYIVQQRSANRFRVTNGTIIGVCTLVNKANGSLSDGEMTMTATRADATTFKLAKVGDINGLDFLGNYYFLTMGTASATPPVGSEFQIVSVETL